MQVPCSLPKLIRCQLQDAGLLCIQEHQQASSSISTSWELCNHPNPRQSSPKHHALLICSTQGSAPRHLAECFASLYTGVAAVSPSSCCSCVPDALSHSTPLHICQRASLFVATSNCDPETDFITFQLNSYGVLCHQPWAVN